MAPDLEPYKSCYIVKDRLNANRTKRSEILAIYLMNELEQNCCEY